MFKPKAPAEPEQIDTPPSPSADDSTAPPWPFGYLTDFKSDSSRSNRREAVRRAVRNGAPDLRELLDSASALADSYGLSASGRQRLHFYGAVARGKRRIGPREWEAVVSRLSRDQGHVPRGLDEASRDIATYYRSRRVARLPIRYQARPRTRRGCNARTRGSRRTSSSSRSAGADPGDEGDPSGFRPAGRGFKQRLRAATGPLRLWLHGLLPEPQGRLLWARIERELAAEREGLVR